VRVVRTQNNELLKSLATLADGSVAVGFFPEDKYPDGKSVAEVASIHEYGAVINRTGSKAGAYQIRIPCRSFMRTTIHEKEQSWVDYCAKILREGMDVEQAMNLMGALIGGDVQLKIRAIAGAGGNAPSTIKKKGFDTPLIDTGNMWRSVSFKTEKGSVTKVGAA
jgi:hypothetical protein